MRHLNLSSNGINEENQAENTWLYENFLPKQQQLFEVDVFEAAHKGLVIAEIELKHAKDTIQLPKWIGKEVTGDKRYYNSYLALHGIPS